jgi:5-methylcytosine-specific restriction endonuclease McrA
MAADRYHSLDPRHTDPKRVAKEREKARKLRKTQWWLDLLNRGLCHYCERKFKRTELTMDHVVPIARGGTSTQGNIVPACAACNTEKKLDTPVDRLFAQLEAERARAKAGSESGGDT